MFKKISKTLLYTYYKATGFFLQSPSAGPIFIVGTGRSGTHFLCSCVRGIEGVDDYFKGKESPLIFWHIANKVALNGCIGSAEIGYYKNFSKKVKPNIFLDQTHPNLWNVSLLRDKLPASRFLGLQRDVYSVVYSMSKHQSVSRWSEEQKLYPRPNNFLGVREGLEKYYDEATLLQRFALRWCSHMEELLVLKYQYPEHFKLLKYEDFQYDYSGQMDSICDFLSLPRKYTSTFFDASAISKKRNLSEIEIEQIRAAVGEYSKVRGVDFGSFSHV